MDARTDWQGAMVGRLQGLEHICIWVWDCDY